MKRIIFLLPFLLNTLFAQGSLNYLTSTDGGSAYEIFFHNNYLYVGCANTLEVWDLTGANATPGNLRFKKRMLSNIDYITEHNGYLYVCANHDGLYKFDLSMTPDSLIEKAHFVPSNINESIYDIAFYGTDTVVVAAKNKLNILVDGVSSFTYQSTIASFSGTTRIHGLDIKNNLLAYTVGFSSIVGQDGVYLFDLITMSQLDFYNNDACSAWDVCFGQNNSLLHVMGGQIGVGSNGLYFVMDYSVPTNMILAYSDTIFPAILSIGSPMNAIIINDTVYIATQGGRPVVGPPNTVEVYVYDATDSSNVLFLTNIYAGLYHFDLDINEANRTMYIASEWYGIWTVDVNDIYSEIVYPNKHTGGWCHGSATANNILVEANEGYGIRMFNVSTIQAPILIHEDTTGGFCRAISMSDGGEYVFGWFLTGESFRIYDGSTLSLLADISVNHSFISDFKKSRYHNNKVAVVEELLTSRQIDLADVTNPLAPTFLYRTNNSLLGFQDLQWHASGKLLACTGDSLLVLDSAMNLIAFAKPVPGWNYRAMAISNDTVFVFCKHLFGSDSLRTYYYDDIGGTLSHIASVSYPMNVNIGGRIFMACDTGLIYISSTIDQLKAISKSTFTGLGTYDHGADHVYDNLWGVHDLYYKNGYLFLNEYMGHTSIFGSPNTTSVEEIMENDPLIIYPNPTTEYFIINIEGITESLVKIYSIEGKLMYSANLFGDKIQLSTYGFTPGTYFVTISIDGKENTEKLIITR